MLRGKSLFIFVFFALGLHAFAEHDVRQRASGRADAPSEAQEKIKASSVDIEADYPNGIWGSLCQATPIKNEPLPDKPEVCKVALFTAAHCISKFGNYLTSLKIDGVGTLKSEEILFKQIMSKYREAELNHVRNGTADKIFERGQPGDAGVVIFVKPCSEVKSLIPAPLASTSKTGEVELQRVLFPQKRHSPTQGGNTGGGAIVRADLQRDRDSAGNIRLFIPSPQGDFITQGDSGGPIFNDKGEIVGAISTADAKEATSEFQVGFNASGVPWAKKILEKYFATPTQTVSSNSSAEQHGLDPAIWIAESCTQEGCNYKNKLTGEIKFVPTERSSGGTHSSQPESASGTQPTERKRREVASEDAYSSICLSGKNVFGRNPDGSIFPMTVNSEGQILSATGPVDENIKKELLDFYISNFDGLQRSGLMIPEKIAFIRKSIPSAQSTQSNLSVTIVTGKNPDGSFWCPPCRRYDPIVARLKAALPGVEFKEIAVSSNNTPPGGVPETRIESDGQIIEVLSGGQDFNTMVSKLSQGKTAATIQQLLAEYKKTGKKISSCVEGDTNSLPFQSNGQTQPSRQNEAQSTLPLGLQPIPAHQAIAARPEGMWGWAFDQNGKKVWAPLFISQRTGQLRAGQNGEFRLAPETAAQLAQYYGSNQNRFTGNRALLVGGFLRTQGVAISPELGVPDRIVGTQPRQPIPQNVPQQNRPDLTQLSAEDQQAIHEYEDLRYEIAGRPHRERFPEDTFRDIPQGGTGQMILAYFGQRRPDLEQMVQGNPLVTVRNYPIGSPEHRHAQLFGTQALGIDGLGRKITRYGMDPKTALGFMLKDPEVGKLQRYLQARQRLASGVTPQQIPQSNVQTPDLSSLTNNPQFHGAAGKCLNCHVGSDSAPVGVKSPQGLLNHMGNMNDMQLEDMIGRAGLSQEEAHAIREYVSKARNRQQISQDFSGRSKVPACFMSPQEQAQKTASLPNITGSSSALSNLLNGAKTAGQLIFYDKSSVPKAWNEGLGGGILSPEHKTNAGMMDKMGYHSNAGMEFPWLNPAGMDISQNGSSEKFVIPPANGQMMSAIMRTRSNSPGHFGSSTNVNGPNLGWQYNAGTTFGEILKVNGLPFEIRLRSKQPDGSWAMDVLRPFENARDLANQIKQLCVGEGKPAGCDKVASAVKEIESANSTVFSQKQVINRQNFGTKREPLALSSTALSATAAAASLQVLPELPPDVVTALLTKTPFKSVFGKPWTEGPPPGWAPTTNSTSSIVPQNYFGGMIAMNQQSCMKCHDSAGKHVDNFDPHPSQMFAPDPGDAQRPRTWYDFVQGDDGILSFHPFRKDAVRNRNRSDRNAINPCLTQTGLLR